MTEAALRWLRFTIVFLNVRSLRRMSDIVAGRLDVMLYEAQPMISAIEYRRSPLSEDRRSPKIASIPGPKA
jgi:hypothetical protein